MEWTYHIKYRYHPTSLIILISKRTSVIFTDTIKVFCYLIILLHVYLFIFGVVNRIIRVHIVMVFICRISDIKCFDTLSYTRCVRFSVVISLYVFTTKHRCICQFVFEMYFLFEIQNKRWEISNIKCLKSVCCIQLFLNNFTYWCFYFFFLF